jgi:hypothetical protein
MKTYKYLSIISIALFIGIIGYTIGLNERVNKQIDHFKMGEILYPDYVHEDTLIVYDPEYLNQCLSDGKLKTDADILEILNETTVRYSVLPNTITKQETDERGLTSVQYIKDGEEGGLDYLTKHEYDSAFHDYINYKRIETDNWIKLGGKPIRIIN